MTKLATLRLRVLRHAVEQLEALVRHPGLSGCGPVGNLPAVIRLEGLIARHVRDFGLLPMLHLEIDATAYEIGYAARRYFERPDRSASALRIRDLIGIALAR